MTYRLDILSTIGPLSRCTVLFSPDIRVDSWSKRINGSGKMVFSMKATNTKATDEALRVFRRVRLYRQPRAGGGYEPVWFGYIQDKNEVDGRIEVICDGMLGFFASHRFTSQDLNMPGEGSDEAFNLLSATNVLGDTGVTEGTDGVMATADVTTQGRVDLLQAWEDLAKATNAEFEIDDSGALNFVPLLGSDKSGSIHIIYRRDGQPGTNASGIGIGERGRGMANKIIGLSSAAGGLTSIQEDLGSQGTYGVLEDVRQFNEAQDQTTLDTMTLSELSQRALPIPDFEIIPTLARPRFNVRTGQRDLSGLDYSDAVPGDLVKATIVTENSHAITTKRIVEVAVTVDEGGAEKLSWTLSEAGIFITAAYLDANRVEDLARRLRDVENLLA